MNLLENETGWVKCHRLRWKFVSVERLHCHSIKRHRKKREYWFPVPIFWTAWIPWDFHVAFETVRIARTHTNIDLNFAIPVRDMLKLDQVEIEEGGSCYEKNTSICNFFRSTINIAFWYKAFPNIPWDWYLANVHRVIVMQHCNIWNWTLRQIDRSIKTQLISPTQLWNIDVS